MHVKSKEVTVMTDLNLAMRLELLALIGRMADDLRQHHDESKVDAPTILDALLGDLRQIVTAGGDPSKVGAVLSLYETHGGKSLDPEKVVDAFFGQSKIGSFAHK